MKLFDTLYSHTIVFANFRIFWVRLSLIRLFFIALSVASTKRDMCTYMTAHSSPLSLLGSSNLERLISEPWLLISTK